MDKNDITQLAADTFQGLPLLDTMCAVGHSRQPPACLFRPGPPHWLSRIHTHAHIPSHHHPPNSSLDETSIQEWPLGIFSGISLLKDLCGANAAPYCP